ncbi:MAG: ATP-binding protein [Pseudomonadota bacterium]
MKKRRLIWQLYPYFVLCILISVIAVTWYASLSLKKFFIQEVKAGLEARIHIFEKQVLKHLDPPDDVVLDSLCKDIGQTSATRFTIILPSGEVVGDTHEDPENMDTHSDRPEIIQALTGASGASLRTSRTLGKNMMYVALSLKKGKQNIGVIRASVAIDPIEHAIERVQIRMIFAALIIAAIGAMFSYLVSRRITKPIKEIQDGAECFSRGEFDCRLPVYGFVEIGSLSESMNRMAGELQKRISTITRQRNESEAVLSSMVEGVFAVDTEERVIHMNQAAGNILRCDLEDARGRSIQEVSRNVDLQNFVKATLSGEKLIEREIILYADTDQILNGHGTILYDEEGRRMGALIVLHDVTRLKKLEDMRRDFVANVSHEIKTPITAIKGFTETLRDGAIENPEDAVRFLKIIDRHVHRLEAIIEDLLSLSRIEGEEQKGEIELKEGSIREVLGTAQQIGQAKAGEKKLRIILNCGEGLAAKINAPLLEQAVVNLLDNAVKYTGEGGTITLEGKPQGNEVVIRVIDQGCGIEKEHLSRIFERFYRADKARSRQMGGTGLGLAIVKHITLAHGGRVSVESTPGKGSTFTITLPLNLS